MENRKNKKLTIEDLAGMVARGFDKSDKKFDSLEYVLKDMNKRLGNVEYQVDEAYDILKRFEENDILNLQKRVQILEKAVRALAGQSSSK